MNGKMIVAAGPLAITLVGVSTFVVTGAAICIAASVAYAIVQLGRSLGPGSK